MFEWHATRSLAPAVGLLVTLAFGGCRREPKNVELPPGWTPVPLAHLSLPPDTACAEGLDWLYGANCTGQDQQPICKLFIESLQVFAPPAQGVHCDPEAREQAQAMALRFTQRSEQRASDEMRQTPEVAHRVDDQRLWLLDGFVQGLVEHGTARPGQEAAAQRFRASYKPTDFKRPLPR